MLKWMLEICRSLSSILCLAHVRMPMSENIAYRIDGIPLVLQVGNLHARLPCVRKGGTGCSCHVQVRSCDAILFEVWSLFKLPWCHSYNAVNGVPTCADPRLLTNILRQQWGWNGFVVSDYDAWAQIYETHRYCPDYECAAAAGINAGMDQEGTLGGAA